MPVRLDAVAADEFWRVGHLRVAPHQIKFSGTVGQAFKLAEEGVDFHAIFLGPRAVGFFKIDRDYGAEHPFARPGEPGLRAFLIDHRHQGMGVARKALELFPAYLRARYRDIESLVLTVNMANPAAVKVYRQAGFRDTGEIWEGGAAGAQLVMRMDLAG